MKFLRLISISFVFTFSNISATTIYIPTDYPTIQEGIDASEDGDVVTITQGTYYENLTINKEITLQSSVDFELLENEEIWYDNNHIQQTIINGSINNDPKKRSCLVIRDGDIQPTIKGLTFEGGVGTSMILSNDCASGTAERSGGGILVYDAYPTINYNRFINNGISSENERARKSSKNGGAIAHYEDAEVEFDEDRINSSINNRPSRTIPVSMDIQNNYFEGNSSGNGQDFYSHGFDGSIDVSNSVFANIDCETNTVNDFVLNSFENAADYAQEDILGTCIEEVAFYVSVDGDDSNGGTESAPFATIGHALSFVKDAGSSTTIYVGVGTYSADQTGEVFPILIPNNVHLIGDDAETTILDAAADIDNQAAVVIIKEVETVTLKNFTLRNGNSEGHGCTGGGGLLLTADDMFNLSEGDGGTGIQATSTPLIQNLIIDGNHSHNGGGLGIFRVSGPILDNVIISNNTATAFGGGLFSYISSLTMTNVTVTENENLGDGQGGGMMLAGTQGSFDNMTITNNYANGSHGGGIWTNNSGDNEDGWVMTNSLISNNQSDWGGGGICMLESAPTLDNVTFSYNSANWFGGGISAMWSSPTIKNCNILDNQSYYYYTGFGGGGMVAFGEGAFPIIEDTFIARNVTANEGGGIYFDDADGAILNRVTLVNNSSDRWNGGMSIQSTPVTITNCTIANNSSPNGGGIELWEESTADISNSIIYGNAPTAISWYEGTSATVTYSDIDDGWDGVGNIDADPLFVNTMVSPPGFLDYSLQIGSPCIDAGTTDIDQNGTVDITEYFGSAPDMGAYEIMNVGLTDFSISTSFVSPLTESVNISTSIFGDVNAQSVIAKINDAITGEQTEISLTENNGLWSGSWIPQTESFFNIDMQMNNDEMFIYENIESFTSVGPININLTGDLNIGPNTVNICTFTLENNSSSQAVADLAVSFQARSNECLQTMTGTAFQFDVLESGELTDSYDLIVATNFNCTAGTLIEIDANISSGGTAYWVDSIVLTMDALGADQDNIPAKYNLTETYPNPFNPATKFSYEIPNTEHVSIDIYNLAGSHIKSLVSSIQNPGFKTIHWNATNDRNEPVSAGLYLYTIQAGEFRQTKKMVLLK